MSITVALGMVLASWLTVGASCVGWGTLLMRLLLPQATSPMKLQNLFWAGFSMLIGLLHVWHFFLPIDWRATIALICGGVIIGLLLGSFRISLPEKIGRALLFSLLALWLAYRGLDFPQNYDSGLYHFASIRWINEFPVVPGLANLHERLGFNQGHFLFVALLNVHPYFGEGYHVAGSLLWFVLTAPMLAASLTLLRNHRPASRAVITQCLLLPIALAHALGGDISSPTPDFAVFAIGIAAFVMLVQKLEIIRDDEPSHRSSTLILSMLLATGCTMKLSFALFGVTVASVLLFSDWNQYSSPKQGKTKWVLLTLSGAFLFWGIPGALHSIVLSGYPAFPSTLLAWPVDWRLPLTEAQATADWVRSWARTPGMHYREVLSSWSWLGPWWQRTSALPGVYLPLLFTALGGLGFGVAWWRPRTRAYSANTGGWRLPFVPVIGGLIFWFFTAPDPRFASWLLWLLAVWTLACVVQVVANAHDAVWARVLAGVSIASAVGVIILGISVWWRPGRYGFDSLPRVVTTKFVTQSGLTIILPVNNQEVRLWDTPLPSAPLAKPNLEMRGSDFSRGFRTSLPPPAPAE